MNPDNSSTFATTRWTRVLAAQGGSEPARAALGELCSAYYGPVLAFLTHTGCGDADPRDVAHEFFAALLSGRGIDGADPGRGRFRTYLLGALKHFLANRRRDAQRLRRGGDATHVPLVIPTDTQAEVDHPEVAQAPPSDAVFDREWALAVIERALGALEQEATDAGQGAPYEALKPWLSLDGAPGSQAAAAARLGISEGAVKVAVHRWRKRFRELIRAEILQTLPEDGDAAAELRHLMEALG